jgi:hypothetical protein
MRCPLGGGRRWRRAAGHAFGFNVVGNTAQCDPEHHWDYREGKGGVRCKSKALWYDALTLSPGNLQRSIMATCPTCLGPLTEHHKCPHGVFRRIAVALAVLTVGGVAGGLSTWALTDRPEPALVLAVSALGAVLARGVGAAVGRKS